MCLGVYLLFIEYSDLVYEDLASECHVTPVASTGFLNSIGDRGGRLTVRDADGVLGVPWLLALVFSQLCL